MAFQLSTAYCVSYRVSLSQQVITLSQVQPLEEFLKSVGNRPTDNDEVSFVKVIDLTL